MPDEDKMPFPVVAFTQCGLRFPLDPLFREFLHYYTLNPMLPALAALPWPSHGMAIARSCTPRRRNSCSAHGCKLSKKLKSSF